MSYCIPQKTMNVITYPCRNSLFIPASNRGHRKHPQRGPTSLMFKGQRNWLDVKLGNYGLVIQFQSRITMPHIINTQEVEWSNVVSWPKRHKISIRNSVIKVSVFIEYWCNYWKIKGIFVCDVHMGQSRIFINTLHIKSKPQYHEICWIKNSLQSIWIWI